MWGCGDNWWKSVSPPLPPCGFWGVNVRLSDPKSSCQPLPLTSELRYPPVIIVSLDLKLSNGLYPKGIKHRHTLPLFPREVCVLVEMHLWGGEVLFRLFWKRCGYENKSFFSIPLSRVSGRKHSKKNVAFLQCTCLCAFQFTEWDSQGRNIPSGVCPKKLPMMECQDLWWL